MGSCFFPVGIIECTSVSLVSTVNGRSDPPPKKKRSKLEKSELPAESPMPARKQHNIDLSLEANSTENLLLIDPNKRKPNKKSVIV